MKNDSEKMDGTGIKRSASCVLTLPKIYLIHKGNYKLYNNSEITPAAMTHK